VRPAAIAVAAALASLALAPRAWAQEAEPDPEPEEASPPADAPSAPAEAEPPVRMGRSFYFAADAGGMGQRFVGVPVYGADFGLALGTDFVSAPGILRGGFFQLRLDYALGQTEHGVGARTFRIAPEVGFLIGDRVRLGVDVHLANAGFWRATDGHLVDDTLVGVGAFATVDVARFDRHAIYLSLRGNDTAHSTRNDGGDDVRDLTLSAGFRF
jgi:hypothetical protein